MKENRALGILYVFNFSLFVIIFVLILSYFNRVINFLKSINSLIIYYDYIGDLLNKDGFIFVYNFIIISFYIFLILLLFITFISRGISNRIQFSKYPHTRHDYRGYIYFVLTGGLGLIIIALIYLNVKITLINKFDIACLYIAYNVILLIQSIGNRVYNKVQTRVKDIIDNNFEYQEETSIELRKYKISNIFYTLLILSIIPLCITLNKGLTYRQNYKLPSELVIDKNGLSLDNGFLLDDLLENHYKLSSIKITIRNQEDIKLLEENSYKIVINYNNRTYDLKSFHYSLVKTNDYYEYNIDFKECLQGIDLKQENF